MDATPSQVVPSEFVELDTDFPDLALPDDEPKALSTRTIPSMAPVEEIPVKVQAVLGGARLQIAELLQTRAGSVIELDRRVGEPVDVYVNERLIARGELVLIDGSLGITLTEIVKQER